jgi:hypothetical protein
MILEGRRIKLVCELLFYSFIFISTCIGIFGGMYVLYFFCMLDIQNRNLFLCPWEIEDQRAYCFCPVCNSIIICHVFLSSTKNFNLGYNFWMVSTRLWYFTWVFIVTRPFHGYKKNLTLWPWPWCLNYLLKTLTMAMSFEWYISHECSLWQDLSMSTKTIWPCDLDLGAWPTY